MPGAVSSVFHPLLPSSDQSVIARTSTPSLRRSAIGNNAALDKVKFFGEDREGPNKTWPEADDRAFMTAGQQIAGRLPMDLVVALAEAMLNEHRVERGRILEIATPFLQ